MSPAAISVPSSANLNDDSESRLAECANAPVPIISIIVPAYNRERHIEQTVASIQAQTIVDWELIIVDDGATDGTLAIVERMASADLRIRIVRQPNGGPSRARNHGVDQANPHSSYITFIDADDLWLPGTLAALLGAIDLHPEWSGVHGVGQYIDDADEPLSPGELEGWCRNRLRISKDFRRRELCPLSAPTTFDMLAVRDYIPMGTVLLRRSDYERTGGFKEDLRGSEDWHMLMRICLNRPIGFVDRVVFQYRRHETNVSNDAGHMNREKYRAARDLYDNHLAGDEKRRWSFLRSQTVATHLYWAADQAREGKPLAALLHAGIATRNVIEYHMLPKIVWRLRSGRHD